MGMLNKEPITIYTYFCPACGRSCESKDCRIEKRGLFSSMYCSNCKDSKVIMGGPALIIIGLLISLGFSITIPLSGSQAPALFILLSFILFGTFRMGKQLVTKRDKENTKHKSGM
jgi:hypothetical protein